MIAAYTLLSGAQGAQLDTLGELSGIGRDVLGEGTSLEDGSTAGWCGRRSSRTSSKGQAGGALLHLGDGVWERPGHTGCSDNQDMTMGVELTGSDYSRK